MMTRKQKERGKGNKMNLKRKTGYLSVCMHRIIWKLLENIVIHATVTAEPNKNIDIVCG